MSIVGRSCVAAILMLCGTALFLSASAWSENDSANNPTASTNTPTAPFNIIDHLHIRDSSEVSENELLARFIIDQDNKDSLIQLYAYPYSQVCGDASADNDDGKEVDWFQSLWAETVKKVGVVTVIPMKYAEDIDPVYFGSFSENDGNIVWHTQDNLCDFLKNSPFMEGDLSWFENSGLVAIQYPYVDREYDGVFFLEAQSNE